MTRPRCIIAGLVAALLTPAAALGAEGDWRIGYRDQIDSLNPIVQQASTAQAATGMSYDRLLNPSIDDLSPDTEHSLAKSYEASDRGLTWTFELNEDIEWSDGRPFTSADVKWTYEQILETPSSALGLALMGLREVQTPDDFTVVLKLSEPNPNIPLAFVPILPKHVWSKLPKREIEKGPGPIPNVTTGPFVITKFDPRGDTILEANPRYRFGAPKAKRLLWIKYGDEAGQLRDLRLKQLDAVFQAKPDWPAQVRNDRNIRVWSADSPSLVVLAFNSCPPRGTATCERPGEGVNTEVVQDPAIRTALSAVLDRRQIVDTVFDGHATPGVTGLIPPYYRTFEPEALAGESADVDAAKAALADGGWDCSQNPCVKDGTKAELKLMYDPADAVFNPLAQRIRAQAAEVNIDLELEPLNQDAMEGRIYAPGSKEGTFRPSYDALVAGWTGIPSGPDALMKLLLGSDSPFAEVYYSNEEYDRLMAEADTAMEPAERTTLVKQANEIAQRDLPYIVVANQRSIALTRNDAWHGYQASPSGNGTPWGVTARQIAMLVPGPAPGTSTADDGGSSTGLIAAIVAGAAVLALGALLLVRRRRRAGPGSDAEWTEA